jgi:benzoyl-CoA reductase subunit A
VKCCVGIDLGSTTTKAVVLDEQGEILGRGVTNSRSNYDVACSVARGEALLDARFQLFRRALANDPELSDHGRSFLADAQSAFRLEQYLTQLAELEETSNVEADARALADDARATLRSIFRALRDEAPALHAPGQRPRSDFFRDVAGSRYAALAQTAAERSGVVYELLLGVFDKSILAVEGRVPAWELQETIERALACAQAGTPVSERLATALSAAVRQAIETPLVEARSVGTGYGRARLPFPKERIRSEILCHGLGAHATFPRTRTVLDIGGQDTKAIQLDENGIVTTFQMNDRCAAGCGRYLGYIADEMNLGLHELGPLALCAKKPVRISSTCTVFAGAELRDRLASGQRREDILGGLHRAIMLRAMSLLARSGGIREEFTFTGGVARNEAAVRALRGLVRENYGERTLNTSPDSIYTGALGAALFAWRETRGETAAPGLAVEGAA